MGRCMSILVLGIGNPIMSDDGVGVRVVELLLERYRLPAGVSVQQGGTMGLALLPQVEDAERLLLVDAVDAGKPPGTLVRLTGTDIPSALEARMSPHQLGLKELLCVAALLGKGPKETVLWGVQPESLAVSLDLSAAVEAKLEPLLANLVQELACWGAVLEPVAARRNQLTTGSAAACCVQHHFSIENYR